MVVDYCAAGSFSSLWSGWQPVSIMALFASAIVLALAFMAARAFRRPGLSAWVNAEFGQLLMTTAIFLFIVAIVAGLCNLDAGLLSPRLAGKDIFGGAESYLGWLREVHMTAFFWTFATNSFLSYISTPIFNARPGGMGISTVPLAGLSPAVSMMGVFMNALMLSLTVTVMQIIALKYIKIAMLGYFLPLGLFFRAFEPTRYFGGALIGLSIGLFLFYPLMLVFNDVAVHDELNATAVYVQNAAAAADVSFGEQILHLGEDFFSMSLSSTSSFGTTVIMTVPNMRIDQVAAGTVLHGYADDGTPMTITVTAIDGSSIDATDGYYTLKQQGPDLEVYMNFGDKFQERIAHWLGLLNVTWVLTFKTFVAGMLLPAINFIVIITAVRELSRLLGEEVDVSNLTRMV